MADVFISHASADVHLARELDLALREAGYTVWWDKHLVAGQQYQSAIKHELASAGAVLVLWTPSSVDSPWVYSEARRGIDRRVLVQVRTSELSIDDLPAPFDAFHCPSADDLEAVVDAVSSLVGERPLERLTPTPASASEAGEPQIRSSTELVTALPRFNTPLVGRSAELKDVVALLEQGARLVTLTGPGGSGKTRLAVAVAEYVAERDSRVSLFVAAEAVERTEEFWAVIGTVVGAPAEGRVPPALFEHLAPRSICLVLDNLEQIPTAGRVVADLLQAAPEVVVVATSRLSLHVEGEQDYAVPPLAVPPPGSQRPAGAPAVELFVNHARAVNRTFELTEDNSDHIAEICRRLDGLPLAIELIAARMKLLSARALLGQLERALDLKVGGASRPARHETLRATIQWSYDLLQPDAQRTLRIMSLFPGGVTLSALEFMFEKVAPTADVLASVSQLADASLVPLAEDVNEPRFRLLNTVRSFAATELERTGELPGAYAAMVSWAQWAIFDTAGSAEPSWFTRLKEIARPEHENLRSLLDRDPAPSLDPAHSIWFANVARMSADVVAAPGGFYGEAKRWLSQALDLSRQGDDKPLEIRSLMSLGELHLYLGDQALALETMTTALTEARRLDGAAGPGLTGSLGLLGEALVARTQALIEAGDTVTARQDLREALDLPLRAGADERSLDVPTRVHALLGLAIINSIEGQGDQALVLERQAAELARLHGYKALQLRAEHNAACSLREIGDLAAAEELMRRGMPDMLKLQNAALTLTALDDYALVLLGLRRYEDAALLLGATEESARAIGHRPAPYELEERAPFEDSARAALGDGWTRTKAEGALLSLEQAWRRASGNQQQS